MYQDLCSIIFTIFLTILPERCYSHFRDKNVEALRSNLSKVVKKLGMEVVSGQPLHMPKLVRFVLYRAHG